MTTAHQNAPLGNLIWVASYPKSGNTWMLLWLQSALLRGYLDSPNCPDQKAQIAAVGHSFDHVLDTKLSDLTFQEILKWRPDVLAAYTKEIANIAVLKLHDQSKMADGRDLLPTENTRAILHLVRDPRDVVVSWASHSNLTLDESIDFLNNDDQYLGLTHNTSYTQLPQFLGNWSAHCESWVEYAEKHPVFLSRYEDRQAAPEKLLREVLDFVKIDYDPALLSRVLASTNFQTQQKFEENATFTAKPSKMAKFFRKGIVGDWKTTLTDRQINRIETAHGDCMKKLGYL